MDAGRREKACGGGCGEADLYRVLGLSKECSHEELRMAYRKLALTWHPDRCYLSGSSGCVEEAKNKFQQIQGAYSDWCTALRRFSSLRLKSLLSDSNKRFLYDVGIYDSDNDDDSLEGMGDFLCEMMQMMNQAKLNGSGKESLKDLQQLFVDMFQQDFSKGIYECSTDHAHQLTFTPAAQSTAFCNSEPSVHNKRNNSAMETNFQFNSLDGEYTSQGFCFGAPELPKGRSESGGTDRRNGRKQKLSSKHDVSSRNNGVFM